MPPVGFEPMILVLEQAKTVRALDRAATAIGLMLDDIINYPKIVTIFILLSFNTSSKWYMYHILKIQISE
jgi:hypothetical protein